MKKTFNFDSDLWSNKESFNLDGGKTKHDYQPTGILPSPRYA